MVNVKQYLVSSSKEFYAKINGNNFTGILLKENCIKISNKPIYYYVSLII